MKIGDVVSCRNSPSKGIGTIVGVQQVFGEGYADVFFDRTKEKITLPISELSTLLSPELKFNVKKFSSAQQLNEIAERMYTRVKEIIDSGDLALSFSDLDISSISKHELVVF